MKIKTSIISHSINAAGSDKILEDIINSRFIELNISPDNLIDIKVNTNYYGDELYNQINYLNVDDNEVLINYIITIIYKVED